MNLKALAISIVICASSAASAYTMGEGYNARLKRTGTAQSELVYLRFPAQWDPKLGIHVT